MVQELWTFSLTANEQTDGRTHIVLLGRPNGRAMN